MENKYCILCGHEVMIQDGNHWHEKLLAIDYETGEIILYDCEGILVDCPPPELSLDWIEFVIEPSPDEMELINLFASELLMDMELP